MKLHEKPLIFITTAWMMGVICTAALNESVLYGTVILLLCIAAILFFPDKNLHIAARSIILCVIALSVIRTASYQRISSNDISNFAEKKKVYLYGVVASDPEIITNKIKFTFKAYKVKTYTGIYECSGLTAVTLYPDLYNNQQHSPSIYPSFGDTAVIHGRLSPPHLPTNPGQVDYSKYLSRKRIYCTVSSDVNGYMPEHHQSIGLRLHVFRFKDMLMAKVNDLFNKDQGALLLGILLGNYSSLPYNIQSDFMRTGTMHLLAASGYNCGVIILIFGWLLRFFTVPRTVSQIILIFIIWIFVLLAGAGPSIIRAAIMITLVLLAYPLKRVVDFFNIILFAILILLIYNPLYLYDVGFQLSFAAVLALTLAMPLVGLFLPSQNFSAVVNKRSIKEFISWMWKWLAGVILVSVISFIGTWPITAYYFNYLSLSAVICNALIAALVLPITAFGIAALSIGSIFPSLAYTLAAAASFFLDAMLAIVHAGGNMELSAISVPSPHPAEIMLYYLLVVFIIELMYRVFGNELNSVKQE